MDEKVYNEKREQLQKYVPFLQKLIKKMKEKTIPQHYPLLNKMEILYGLITASNKRLSPETINKCESSLRNLYIKLSDKELSKDDFKLEGLGIHTNSKQKSTNTKKTEEPAPIKIKTEPNIKTEKEDEQEAPTSKSTQSAPNTGSTPVVVKKEVEDSSKKKSGNEDASKKAKAADSRVSTAASNGKDSKGCSNKETAKKVQKSKESPKEVNPEPSKSPTPPKRKTEADSRSESCDITKKIKVEKDVDPSPSPKIVILENNEIPKLHEGQAITKEMLGGILSNVLDSRLVKDLVEKIFAKPNEGTKSLKQRVKTEIVEVDADSQIHEIFDDDDVLLVEDDNTLGCNSKEKGGKLQSSKSTEKAEKVIKDKENSSKTTEEDISMVLDAHIGGTQKQNGETEIIDLDEEENVGSEPSENPATKERIETEIVFETCVISDLPDEDNTGKISKVIEEPPEAAVETNEKKTVEDEQQSKTVGQVKQKKAVKRRNGASKQKKQTKTIKQTCDTSKQENVDEAKQNNKEKAVSEPSKEENLEEEKQSTPERQVSEDPKQESLKQGKQSKTVSTTNEPSKQENVAQKKQSKPAKPTHDATKPEKLEPGTPKKKRKSIINASKPEKYEQDNQDKLARRTSDAFKDEKEEQTKPTDTGRDISDASKPENLDKGKQNKSVRPTNDASKQESEDPSKQAEKRMSISEASKPENLDKGKQSRSGKSKNEVSKQESVEQVKKTEKRMSISDASKPENLDKGKQNKLVKPTNDASKQESVEQAKKTEKRMSISEASKPENLDKGKQNKLVKPTNDASKQESVEQAKKTEKRMSISEASKPENLDKGKQNKLVKPTNDASKQESVEQAKKTEKRMSISEASKQENLDKGKQNKLVKPTNDNSKQESVEQAKKTEKRMSISEASKPENLDKGKQNKLVKPTNDNSKKESVEQAKKTEKRMSISEASKLENLDKAKQNKLVKPANDNSKQESVEQAKKTEKRMSISEASKPENSNKGKQNKLVKPTNDASKQESVEQAKKTEKRISISEASKPENLNKGKQNKSVKPTNDASKQESVEQEKLDTTTEPTNGDHKDNGKKEEEESKQEEVVKQPEPVQEKVKTKEYEDNQIGKVKKLENNNLKITLKRKKSKDKTKAEKRARKESEGKSKETDVSKDDSKEKSEEKSKINEEVVESPKKLTEKPKEAESTNKYTPILKDCKEESNETRVKEEVIESKEEDSTMDEINGNEEETGDKELANILEPLVLINDGTENGPEATTVVSVEPDFQHYSADGWTTDDDQETGLNKVHKKSKSKYKDNKVKKRKLMLDWPSFGSKKKKKNKISQIPKKINFDLSNFNVASDILPKKFEIDVTLFKYDFRHLKNNKMNVRDFEILQRQVEKSFPGKTPPKNTDVNMLPDVLQCALCPHTDRFLPSHYVRFHSDSEVLVSRLPFEAVEALKSNLNNVPERVNKMHYRMMCQFCQTHLTFTTRAWRSHYMRHTGEYQFKCTTCNIHASQTSRFVNHKSFCKNPDIVQIRVWERCMKNVDAFVCDICNYIQMQEDGLRKHVATQHDTLVTYSHVVLVDVLGIMDGHANNSLVPEPPKQVQFIPNTNRDVHLKNPIYRRQCVLCDYNGPYIVKHYARTHHEGELFTARLSPETLENLKKDINNVAVKQKNEFLHVHVFQYRCPFCDLHFIFSAKSWIEHLGEHTGECKYQCNVCWRTAHNIEDFKQFDECPHTNITLDDEIYKKMKYIQYAFVCAFCNFTQLNRKRVENHLRLQHNFQLESIDDKISEVALLKFEGYDRFCNPFGETNPEMELNEETMGGPPVGAAIPVVASQRSESPTNSYDQSTPTNHSTTAPRSENVWPYQNGVHLDQYGIVLTDDSLNSSTSTNLAMVSPNQSIESPISTNMPSTDSSPEGTSPPKGRPPKNAAQNPNSTITKPIVQSVSPLNVVPSVPISPNNIGSMAPPVTAMNTSSSTNSNTFSSQFSRYATSRSSNHRDGFIDLTHLEEERMIASRQIDHRLHGQPIIRKVKNIGFCKDGIRQFYCLIQGCNFSTSMSYIIRDHIAKDHPKTVWDSYCFDCKGFTLLKRTYSCVTEYKHMLDMHVITDRADKAKSTFIITQFKDGNLPIKRVCNIGYTINEENKVFLYCLADGCKVKTPHMYTLLDHIDKIHQSVLWDHYCEMCNRFVAPKGWALLRKELQHLQEKHTSPPKSPAERQQPVPPIVSVQPRLPTKTVMAQPRNMNNSPLNHLRTSICNGATSVTSLSNSVSLIAKSGNGKPTLKVRRLSGDNLSAQKALEAALGQQQHLTGQQNPGQLGASIEPNKISTPPGVVIKQINPPSGIDQHKATVQPQQMQNHMLSPDSTMHMNSNEIQEVDSAMLPPNPVKPWTRSLSVKMPEAAQKQVREVCLYALYKCMGSNCTYVTSCIENMRKHLGYHEQAAATAISPSTNQSFYECPYCPLSVLNVTKLLDHIKGEHGRDLYQCPYCFYRSCDAQNVLTHLRLLHKDRNHLILLCNGEPRTLEAEFSMVMVSLKANVEPLQCMKCRLNFFIIKTFVDHMTQIHGVQTNDGSINCGMCVRVKSSPDNLIKHLLTTHKKGYYECVYCAFATNTFELMGPHLAHVHNSKLPYVCVRKPKNEAEVPAPGKQTLSNSTMLTCVVEQIESKRILKCPFAERELIFVSPMSANNNYTTACSTSSSPPSYPNSMMGQQRLGPPPMEQMKPKGNGLQMSPSQMMSPGKQAMMHMNAQTHMSNVAPVRPQAINPHMPLNHRHPSSMDMSRYDNQYANPSPFYRAIFYPNMVQQNAMMPR